ncbi:MAG: serine hydrolase domain-containing protein, partial [Dehalococcoidia bacterium]
GTVYRIESVTKLFEAMEMMQQRDAGKYQVSDAVASYVPEVSYSYDVPNLGTTTTWYPSFLELASHTSGLPDAVPALSGTSSEQIQKFWQYLNTQTVTTPRAYQYSDLGTVAMGQAVALIAGCNNSGAGQAFHQYVTEQILQPLGMTASTFDYETVPPRDLAIPYLASGQSWTPATDALDFNFPLAGDVFTSVQDMAKFISLQFKTGPAGGTQILACTSIQEMWQPVAPTVPRAFPTCAS